MPFNRAMMFGGPRTFVLASITVEDLAFSYNVEAQVISQFGVSGTLPGDTVILSIGPIILATISTGLDADGLDDLAIFTINIESGTEILGRGGQGGKGGNAEYDPEPPHLGNIAFAGAVGGAGLTPIRLGCVTFIKGAAGIISKGYGAGGGGGGDYGPPAGGGGGGGGGVPYGSGGAGGTILAGGGVAGTAGGGATKTVLGTGGAGGNDGGTGGNGGDSGTAPTAGAAGNAAGGAAGADGNAINSQGFANTIDGGITVTGAII